MEAGELIFNQKWQLHDDDEIKTDPEKLQVKKLELLHTSNLTAEALNGWLQSWPKIRTLTLKLPVDVNSLYEVLPKYHNLEQVVLIYESEADPIDTNELNKLEETPHMPTIYVSDFSLRR